jgi:hypothetical protein
MNDLFSKANYQGGSSHIGKSGAVAATVAILSRDE